MQTLTITQTGLDEIAAGVLHHTGQELTPAQVAACASHIESMWLDGESVCYEISQFKTFSGRPELVCLSDAGYQVTEEEEDE